MANKPIRSIEEQVEDLAKKQLAGVKYYTKTETINSEIETALKSAPSKSGGTGTNIPDIKLLLETKTMRRIPVMIEVKGKKGDFIKLTADDEIIGGAENENDGYYMGFVVSKTIINLICSFHLQELFA